MNGALLNAANANLSSGVPTPGSFIQGQLLAEGSALSLQISGTYSAVPTVQQSLDGVNWVSVAAASILNINTGSTGLSTGVTGLFVAIALAPGAQWRVCLSSYTSGTAVVTALGALTSSASGGGGGSGSAATALSVFGETGVAAGAAPSYIEETLATATTGTAFSSISGFSAYQGRSIVFVTNPNANCNFYLKFCATASAPNVSATSFTDIVPAMTCKPFPVDYLVRLRWAHDSGSTVTGIFCEAY